MNETDDALQRAVSQDSQNSVIEMVDLSDVGTNSFRCLEADVALVRRATTKREWVEMVSGECSIILCLMWPVDCVVLDVVVPRRLLI